jgi:hypothetical protein
VEIHGDRSIKPVSSLRNILKLLDPEEYGPLKLIVQECKYKKTYE